MIEDLLTCGIVSTFTDPEKPHPGKSLKNVKGEGWTREEAL